MNRLIALLLLSATVAQAGLVMHFKLDEGAVDATTNSVYSSIGGWTGTLGGVSLPAWGTSDLPAVPVSEGGTTAALSFDATVQGTTGDPQVLTTYQGIVGTNARTIAAWIKASASQPNFAVFVGYGSNGTAARLSFRLETTTGSDFGKPRCEIQGNARLGSTVLTDSKWHHVAFVMTNGARLGDTLLYVDGNLETAKLANTSGTANYVINTGTNNFVCIGNSTHAGGYGFNGSVDDVRIYDEALSGAQILQLVYGAGNPPSISAPLQNQAPVLGDTNASATFTVAYSGSPTLYFQWKHAGTNLPGRTSDKLVIGPPVTTADLGSYSVTISNLWGVTNSALATLNWGTAPIEPPQQVSIVAQKATFSVTMPSNNAYTYQWQQAGADIPGATGATYVRSGLVLSDTTNYTVRVTLGGASATSVPASLLVLPVPSSPYAALILEDGPVGFWRLGEPNGAGVAVDQTSFHNGTYLGYLGFELGAVGAPTNDTDTASSFSTSGNYVQVPFAEDLNHASAFTLEAWAYPTSPSGRQSIIASRSRFTSSGYELLANGTAWQFRTGASQDTSVENWNDLNGGVVTPNVWSHIVATYDGVTKRLYVNGTLVASAVNAVFPSPGTTLRIGADDTYQASASSFFNGTLDEVAVYRKVLTPDQIKDHFNMGVIGVGVAPTFVAQPQSQKLVLGATNTTVTFTGNVNGSPRLRYTWKKGGANLPGQEASSLVISPASGADLGVYALAVTNNSGGILSTNATLSYGTGPIAPNAQAVLLGGAATFTLTGMPAYQTFDYQWKHSGTNLPGATAVSLTRSSATAADAGDYSVVATLGVDSAESAPATLTVIPAPSLSYATVVASDTPVAWWKLDDAPGSFTAANAATPGVNEGSVYPDATMGAESALLGSSGTSAAFTGYSQGTRAGQAKIDFAASPALNPSQFTIECWTLVRGGAGTYRSPVTSRNAGTGIAEGYLFYAGTDDRWQFWLGNGTAWTALTGPAVSANEWVHLVGTYDGTTAAFYVNGALAASGAAAFVPNDTYGLRIGAGATEDTVGSFFLPGRVDEVAVYDRALSAARVQAHYAAAFQPNAAPRFTLQPLTRAALVGQPITLAAKAHATPPFSLQWQKHGTNLPGATSANLALGSASASDAAPYRLAASSGSGSATSSNAVLTVPIGEAVSVNFSGFSAPTIAANDGWAGFVRVTNWNEVGYNLASGTATNLVNNKGVATPMVVSWASTTTRQWSGPLTTPTGDDALFAGFLEANTTNVMVTLGSIPVAYQTAGYSLYVYFGAPNATAGQVSPVDWFGSVRVGSLTNYYHAMDLALWDGRFVRATNTNPLDTAPADANYAVFTGLNASSVTAVVEAHPTLFTGPESISGVQLVANVLSPVPLQVSMQGGQLVLSWTGDWVLQQKTILDQNLLSWTDLTGAKSPYTVPQPLQTQQFFRLRSP